MTLNEGFAWTELLYNYLIQTNKQIRNCFLYKHKYNPENTGFAFSRIPTINFDQTDDYEMKSKWPPSHHNILPPAFIGKWTFFLLGYSTL